MSADTILDAVAEMDHRQRKELLGNLLGSLVGDTSPRDRQQILHSVFMGGQRAKPVIDMVEY